MLCSVSRPPLSSIMSWMRSKRRNGTASTIPATGFKVRHKQEQEPQQTACAGFACCCCLPACLPDRKAVSSCRRLLPRRRQLFPHTSISGTRVILSSLRPLLPLSSRPPFYHPRSTFRTRLSSTFRLSFSNSRKYLLSQRSEERVLLCGCGNRCQGLDV